MDITALIIRFMADWLIVIIAIISISALLYAHPKLSKKGYLEAIAVIGLGFIIARLLSLLYHGERPYVELGVAPGAWAVNNPGFPSEHAMVASALVLIVWVVTRNKALTAMLAGFSFAVCLGRVAALVHTPADVVVGGLCAVVAAWVIYRERLFKTH
jgi:membrane-associated phospholipid phosphatase